MIDSSDVELPGQNQVLLVADGMGGHQGGEIASSTVLEIFRSHSSRIKDRESLLKVVDYSSKKLNQMVEEDSAPFGCGTTIAGMFIIGKTALVFNIGDSRVYRLSPESGLKRLTTDHSLAQELFDKGALYGGWNAALPQEEHGHILHHC